MILLLLLLLRLLVVLPFMGRVRNYSSEATVVCAGERAVYKHSVGVLVHWMVILRVMMLLIMIMMLIVIDAMTGGGRCLILTHLALAYVLFVWWRRRRDVVRGDGRRRDGRSARAGREVRVRVQVVVHPPQVGTTRKSCIQLHHVLQGSSRRLVQLSVRRSVRSYVIQGALRMRTRSRSWWWSRKWMIPTSGEGVDALLRRSANTGWRTDTTGMSLQ